jgi:cytochrome c oxidase subunit IV
MESRVAHHDTHQTGSAGASHGIGRYIMVWIALLIFTVITVITGKMDLGAANIFIAMTIAVTKATLVVLFFMHLYDEGGVNRLVFVVSLLFLAVLILGVFGDLMTRLPISLPNEGPMPPIPQVSPGSSSATH